MREREHIPLRANMWQSELLHLQIVFCADGIAHNTQALCWGAKNCRRLCAKRRNKFFPRSKPGTITITASSTTFVETKLSGNLCGHCWSFYLAKRTQRSIMLYKADALQNSALYWNQINLKFLCEVTRVGWDSLQCKEGTRILIKLCLQMSMYKKWKRVKLKG